MDGIEGGHFYAQKPIPMDERDALFQSILANPHDDVVRLVFADWLEEHSEAEYANFIRIQIALSKLPDHVGEIFFNLHSPRICVNSTSVRVKRLEYLNFADNFLSPAAATWIANCEEPLQLEGIDL